jgi:outer membrane protein assembly factor BamB
LATDDFVFTASSSGVVNCYDLGTGRKWWTQEFDESFYPSPIMADSRIYAMDNRGTLHVFRASKTFEPVADSRLGEESVATPAFAGNAMFIRGKDNLYCIEAKRP